MPEPDYGRFERILAENQNEWTAKIICKYGLQKVIGQYGSVTACKEELDQKMIRAMYPEALYTSKNEDDPLTQSTIIDLNILSTNLNKSVNDFLQEYDMYGFLHSKSLKEFNVLNNMKE